MSITSIIGKLFLPRQKELERHINEAGHFRTRCWHI